VVPKIKADRQVWMALHSSISNLMPFLSKASKVRGNPVIIQDFPVLIMQAFEETDVAQTA